MTCTGWAHARLAGSTAGVGGLSTGTPPQKKGFNRRATQDLTETDPLGPGGDPDTKNENEIVGISARTKPPSARQHRIVPSCHGPAPPPPPPTTTSSLPPAYPEDPRSQLRTVRTLINLRQRHLRHAHPATAVPAAHPQACDQGGPQGTRFFFFFANDRP